MEDLPILKYNDLRDVMWLDRHDSLMGTVVDDASLEVMLRIEKTLSRLDVVGADDKRILWIELKVPCRMMSNHSADVLPLKLFIGAKVRISTQINASSET